MHNTYVIIILDPEIISHHLDFSQWFSFEISRRGEISTVIHPDNEHADVIAIKNGIASYLASKLHHPHEVLDQSDGDTSTWHYKADDVRKHGTVVANYTAWKTADGHNFVQTSETKEDNIPNGRTAQIKNITVHNELGTIQKISLEENFHMKFEAVEGFNPNHGMRDVESVSSFNDTEIPGLHAVSNGDLVFVTKRPITLNMSVPTNVKRRQLHETVERQKRPVTKSDLRDLHNGIQGNLTCMRNEPENGSPILTECFRNLISLIEQLPDSDMELLANKYFNAVKQTENTDDIFAIVDAFGAIGGEREQNLILEKLFMTDRFNEHMIERILTSLIGLQKAPNSELVNIILNMCKTGKAPNGLQISNSLKELSCLTFGGLMKSMNKYGDADTAHELIEHIHSLLGLHDPWEYRNKRSIMSEADSFVYDHNKVTLLDTLGNAGLPTSYEYIVSHINSSNSQWIKRTGIFALRKFDNQEIVSELYKAANFDEHETVRYEAMLAYQAHPLVNAQSIGPLTEHHMKERSLGNIVLFDIHLSAPVVDFRRELGVSALGASFGVIMQNLMDLYISLLRGNVDIKVHDEVYAKVHIGMIGKNFDFFIGRLCFKGGARYDVNILQDMDLELMIKLVTQFSKIVREIVSPIRRGVQFFKDIISGDITLKDIVDTFINAVKQLDENVTGFLKSAKNIQQRLALVNLKSMPALNAAVDKFLSTLIQQLEKINEDVMGFINASVVSTYMI
ncbi:hypothetical protein ACF0H5_019680 [Mactra antiquata]